MTRPKGEDSVEKIVAHALNAERACSSGCTCLQDAMAIDNFRTELLPVVVKEYNQRNSWQEQKDFLVESSITVDARAAEPLSMRLFEFSKCVSNKGGGHDCSHLCFCQTAVEKMLDISAGHKNRVLKAAVRYIRNRLLMALMLDKVCELFRTGHVHLSEDPNGTPRINWTQKICKSLGSTPKELSNLKSSLGLSPSNVLLVAANYPSLDDFLGSVGGCYFHATEMQGKAIELFHRLALASPKKSWEDIAPVGADLNTNSKIQYRICTPEPGSLLSAAHGIARNNVVKAEASDLKNELRSLEDGIFSSLNKLRENPPGGSDGGAGSGNKSSPTGKRQRVADKQVIGRVVMMSLLVSLLRSSGHYVQRPHTDVKGQYSEENKGSLFIGFTPLTKDGMFLHVWNRNERRGRLLFVPYGTILLLPGHALHGGGLCSSSVSQNLRMHFYIFLDGISRPEPLGNEYDDEDKQPYSDSYDACAALEEKMEKLFKS